jgi:hypothetical protein
MRKTKTCTECQKQFPISIRLDGKTKSLRSRKVCLECSPYRGPGRSKKICQSCKKEFDVITFIDGRRVPLHSRACCLDCVPFGKNYRTVFKTPPSKRICTICGKEYIYQRNSRHSSVKPGFSIGGHRAKCCGSCKTQKHNVLKKKRCVEYKGGKCSICGYNNYTGSLQFHHVDPNEKDFEIGRNWSKKWNDLKRELDKCILVCANCHGEVHEQIRISSASSCVCRQGVNSSNI